MKNLFIILIFFPFYAFSYNCNDLFEAKIKDSVKSSKIYSEILPKLKEYAKLNPEVREAYTYQSLWKLEKKGNLYQKLTLTINSLKKEAKSSPFLKLETI